LDLAGFSERLRARRAVLHLTASEVSRRARISRTTLRHLELGVQYPEPQTLSRLAKALRTTEAQLTGGAAPVNSDDQRLVHLTDEDLDVAQAFHHAPTRVKNRVLGTLHDLGQRKTLPGAIGEWAERLLALDPEDRQIVTNLITILAKSDPTPNSPLETAQSFARAAVESANKTLAAEPLSTTQVIPPPKKPSRGMRRRKKA